MHQNPSHSSATVRTAVRKRAFTQRTWEALYKRFKELEAEGLTRADLARALNKAPAQITRVLSGPSNMTLETYAEYADALGTYPTVELREPSASNSSPILAVTVLSNVAVATTDETKPTTIGVVSPPRTLIDA